MALTVRTTLFALLTTFALALSGCSDDGGDGGDDGTTTDTGSSSGSSTTSGSSSGTSTTTTTTGPGEEEFQTVYLEGDVDGLGDCQLVGNDQSPVGGVSEDIPADAVGESYSIASEAFGADPAPAPATASLCVYFDDEAGTDAGTSGTIPEGATQFLIYADGAPSPSGIHYNITIG